MPCPFWTKHKSRKTVEEDVTKKGNDEQKVNIDRKPKRITRSSTGQQTITETLDEYLNQIILMEQLIMKRPRKQLLESEN